MSVLERRRPAVPSRRGTALRLTPKAQAVDPTDLSSVRSWAESLPRPRAIDLFCGAGGLSLGLRDAGFSIVMGADSNAWAVESHTANLGGLGYVGDLSDPDELLDQLDGWGIDHVELVAGGVPCQPFSRAGQSKLRELIRAGERHPQDPRALLWRSFMKVVERLEPDAVLVENVPDLPMWDDGSVLSGFLDSLGALGYRVDARIIDCFRFGVPQHRSRLILTGLRAGRVMTWPDESDAFVSLRDAIGDLPPVPGGQRAERLPYVPRPSAASSFVKRMRRDLEPADRDWIDDHMTRSVRIDDWEAYTGLSEGQTYADIPEHLQRYRTDIFTDKYKRLEWNNLSRTITAHIAKDGYWYIHPEQHRTLSIREAARIQTFPDWFRFAGQPSHRYAQIGNAVPPLAAEAVGVALRESLLSSAEPETSRSATREKLLSWSTKQPDHPWRQPEVDPWLVLIGELALDRAGATPSGVYEALCRLAPSAKALCSLPEAENRMLAIGVSKHGAKLLLAVADSIVELFDGVVPDEDLELRAIPGVGDSAAKSVLCFGHGRKSVLLNQSAARVAVRFAGHSRRSRWQLRLDLHALAGPGGTDASFNAAVLKLGSTLCHRTDPRCPECPLRSDCMTGRASIHRELSLLETVV